MFFELTEANMADYDYIQKIGERKLMADFVEYERITGKNWADALLAFDSDAGSYEKFHKEAVLPLLRG